MCKEFSLRETFWKGWLPGKSEWKCNSARKEYNNV